jgi:hypothetical protein
MRTRELIVATAFTFALTACDDEPTTSGGLVGTLEGPRIAESQLALAVVGDVPAGITDVFDLDDTVHLWVHWIALEPPHEIEVVWWEPDDDNFSSILDISDPESEQVTVFTLDFAPLSPTGRWEVEIWLDGEFMRSHIFLAVDSL